MTSRRTFTRNLSHAAAAVWLTARWEQVEAAFASPEAPLSVLTAAEAADLEAIAGQLIPTDDTPGAREAGAVVFIDRALGTFAATQLGAIRDGLTRLRDRVAKKRAGSSFAALDPKAQLALLKQIEKDDRHFFQVVRTATVMAMFGNPSRGGNRGKVGWRLLEFEDRFFWQPPFGDYDRPESPGGQ